MALISQLTNFGDYLVNSGVIFDEVTKTINSVGATAVYSSGFDEVFLYPGSIQFNGSSQYLSLPDTAIPLSGTTFTAECWIYLTGYSPSWAGVYASAIFSTASTNFANGGNFGLQWTIRGTVNSYNSIHVYLNNGINIVGSYNFSLNTWYHVALTHTAAGAWEMYVNGTSVLSTSLVTTWTDNTPYTIGRNSQSTREYYFPGLISNFRIIAGSALYTGNFTPPTTTLLPIANTKLLLTTPNNSGAFFDSSDSNFTVTPVSSPTSISDTPYFIIPVQRQLSNGNTQIAGNLEEYYTILPRSLNLYTTTLNGPITPSTTVSTHSSIFVGQESRDRILIAAITCVGAALSYISSVTIGGVTATRQAGRTAGDFVQADIWSAVVPTGTLVDVVVTRSVGVNDSSVYVYTAYGYNNTNWVGGTDFDATPASTVLMNVTQTYPANSVGIGIYTGENIQISATRTWTGLTFETDATQPDQAILGGVANDVKLTTTASQENIPAGSRSVSFTISDTTRRRPAFAVVGFN